MPGGIRATVRGMIAVALAACGLLLAAGAVLGPRVDLAWEFATLPGLLALLLILLLCVLPLSRRGLFALAALPPRRHRGLGWLALTLALAHVAALALADPLVLRYLRPTLPWYQLAGVLGIALLLTVTLLAEGPGQRWAAARRSNRALHIGLSALALACIAVHVLVSGRYAGAFGLPQQVRAASLALREPAMSGGAPLPLSFPHQQHATINCIDCHHNFTDRSGVDTCLGCHRSARADLKHGPEARLHDFCLHCHRTQTREERHGPAGGCAGCHRREMDFATGGAGAGTHSAG